MSKQDQMFIEVYKTKLASTLNLNCWNQVISCVLQCLKQCIYQTGTGWLIFSEISQSEISFWIADFPVNWFPDK